MCIRLETMTRERMHEFYRSFEYDTAISPKNSVYVYNAESVDQLYDKHMLQGKNHFAVCVCRALGGNDVRGAFASSG